MQVEIKDLQLIFDTGFLNSAIITQAPMSSGYNLTCYKEKNNTGQRYELVSQRSNNTPKEFKSIDAAVASARKIGFKDIAIKLS